MLSFAQKLFRAANRLKVFHFFFSFHYCLLSKLLLPLPIISCVSEKILQTTAPKIEKHTSSSFFYVFTKCNWLFGATKMLNGFENYFLSSSRNEMHQWGFLLDSYFVGNIRLNKKNRIRWRRTESTLNH